MASLLTEVDELLRPDHHYLEVGDDCFFLREYVSGAGYHGDTNSLLLNFKKAMDRRGKPEWPYKARAIHQLSRELLDGLRGLLPAEYLGLCCMVPMPPSRARHDPLYDDRMAQVSHQVATALGVVCLEVLSQVESAEASHASMTRPGPDELFENMQVDAELAAQIPSRGLALVVDDVLTTGSHFKAAKRHLHAHRPDVLVAGVFLARRIFAGGSSSGA